MQSVTARALSQIVVRMFFVLAVLSPAAECVFASSCGAVKHNPPSLADRAMLGADFAGAEKLYRADLAKHPGDAELISGLVHALIRQQKIQEAAEAVKMALSVVPGSPALITLRGEVEYRQGMPWLAGDSAVDSVVLDPCNPRTQLLLANLARLNSLYSSAQRMVTEAHRLDPEDPQIRMEWMKTLPLGKRISEIEAYLAEARGDDESESRHLRQYMDLLRKTASEPHKPCRLRSPTVGTEIPFVIIERGAMHSRTMGLEVKLDNYTTRLQIDTGADGLIVSRSVAEHAGLHPFSQTELNGIGGRGDKTAQTEIADSIQIGNLEFQNCAVKVLDSQSSVVGMDGIIGTDVFSKYLVTLDYPMYKLILGPLPQRPGEDAAPAPGLNTNGAKEEDWDSQPDSVKNDGAEKPAIKGADSKPFDSDSSSNAPPGPKAGEPSPSPVKTRHGPSDRYIAPEMRDFMPVYRVGHDLIIPTELNGKQRKLFILDTGAWATTISPDAAREVTKVHSDNGIEVRGIGGKVDKVYSADEVTFKFGHLFQKVHDAVAFDTSKLSKNLGVEISGFIGASTLSELVIHIDYRDGLVKFEYDPKRGITY